MITDHSALLSEEVFKFCSLQCNFHIWNWEILVYFSCLWYTPRTHTYTPHTHTHHTPCTHTTRTHTQTHHTPHTHTTHTTHNTLHTHDTHTWHSHTTHTHHIYTTHHTHTHRIFTRTRTHFNPHTYTNTRPGQWAYIGSPVIVAIVFIWVHKFIYSRCSQITVLVLH